MTHPGAGFGQVATTMRRARDYFNGRPKYRGATRSDHASSPHSLCTQRRTANDKLRIGIALTICNSNRSEVCG